ncbi:MAG TPA: sigma-70 family RNA polymerase sigma factor [Thermomicrobiales bacterium]|nr:sigma-70 family RNA polymerase sigma factor [Thermomicrobiales bacterium]
MARDLSPRLDAPEEEVGAGPDDAALALAARRDRRQFVHLYERYADRLFRYAKARTGSATAADDIVSETMLSAMEDLRRFDPARGSFAGWLFGIAAHELSARERRRGRLRRAIARMWAPDTAEDDALDSLIRYEDVLLARRLLAILSPADREVVLLRYSAGLRATEIAEALGISHGAARMRLSRALQRMAVELGDDR